MGAQPALSISDYTIIKTLGSGATGKVKLAIHPHTNEPVALKIIRKNLLHRKRNLFTKVRREIAVMKLLTGSSVAAERKRRQFWNNSSEPPQEAHVGVMKLLEVYETDQSFILVLEHCDGGELFDLLVQNGCLSEEYALDLFQQLVHALDFCHKRGVCHRDLKPENVLLTADGRVKLADFGMSGLHTPGSLLETSCGSPQYCAPEVISGQPYVGSAADVWSLGVVLYAMVTGGLPFDDDNLHRLMTKINSGVFYMPEEVPSDLAALIHSMLTVDPLKRATLQEVKESGWFNLRETRSDVCVEEEVNLSSTSHFIPNVPITNPDREIIHYLKDLGLGDDPTIRYRLRSTDPSMERDFYYQLLELCGNSLSFEPAESLPNSPRELGGASRESSRDTFSDVNGKMSPELEPCRALQELVECNNGTRSPNGLQPPWVQSFVDVIAWERMPRRSSHHGTPVGPHHVAAGNGMMTLATLRSVTSM